MKFSCRWLDRYLEHDATPQVLAERLTALGLEVESVHNPAEALRSFVVARVLTAQPHPRADRLRLLTVDAGDGRPRSVVCGAPNARPGMLGVFGPPGAHVPGAGFTLSVATIRGVESEGMMCSARELGLGDEAEGILDLAPDAPVGESYARWAGLDDWRFDLAITPDRADAMSVRGIARDLAAAGVGRLRPLPRPVLDEDAAVEPHPVGIDDARALAFLSRTVDGVRNGPSPPWLACLLEGAGLRPVSALVDITQYFSVGLGRPLHVYDADRLSGPLVARAARAAETMRALNGRDYALDPSLLVIADDRQVHDIAGVMGGEASGVTEATRRVVIEAALFEPSAVARAGRQLGLVTDARQRFERGVDPFFAAPGLDLAAQMIVELVGGRVSPATMAGTIPPPRPAIAYDPGLVRRLAGLDISAEEQARQLGRLGFGWGDDGRVQVPGWRPDIERPADLVGEIVRLHGVDRVPAVALPIAPPRAMLSPAALLERRLARRLAAEGLHEVMSWSFLAEDEARDFGEARHRLANPLSADLAVMRPSLLPGLVAAAGRALARQAEVVGLFERGARYQEREERMLGFVLAGEHAPRHWRTRARSVDAHDARALAGLLLAEAGVDEAVLDVVPDAGPAFHPGRSACLMGHGRLLARLGELHPALAQRRGLRPTLVMGELFLDALAELRHSGRAGPPPPPYPAVVRDFSFVAPVELAGGRLLAAVRAALADWDGRVEAMLFDVWPLPDGDHQALGVTVRVEPAAATLDEAAIERLAEVVVRAGVTVGARLRDAEPGA